MNKRIINLFLVAIVILSGICYAEETADLNVIPENYVLPVDAIVNTQNAEINNNILVVEEGGCVEFDMFMPFECQGISVKYLADVNTTINFEIGNNSYSITIDADNEQVDFDFANSVSLGEYVGKITSVGKINISEIKFNKADPGYPPNYQWILPDIGEYEREIETAVIIKQDASIIRVRGAKRYVNYKEPTETPHLHNGSMYLPLGTLARALEYYVEEIPTKSYVLMRNGAFEFYQLEDRSYCRKNNGDFTEINTSAVIWKNGKAYGSIRYFAEAIDNTVTYRDGIVIIDNRYSSKHLANSAIFDKICEEFSDYIPDKYVGNTYYVAQTSNASDDNDGSFNNPFSTLKKAGEVARSGDTVIIKEGIYREVLMPQNSGTFANPIIFMGAEGENVVISANDEIGPFYSYKENIAVASLNWDLGYGRNQIFYKNEALPEGRYPNTNTAANRKIDKELIESLSPMWAPLGNIRKNPSNGDEAIIYYDAEELDHHSKDYWQGGTFVSLHGYGWAFGTAKIANSKLSDDATTETLSLTETSKEWWFYNTNKYDAGFITNHLNTVDMPGEWYVGDNKVYVYLPENEKVDTVKLEAKKRQLTVDLADKNYIQIHNINTVGGGVRLNNSQMCVVENCTMKYISHYSFSHDQRQGFIDDDNIQDRNGAPLRGEMGIYISGSNNAIINTVIDYSAGAGLYLTGKNTYVENNIISNTGYMGSYVGGIFVSKEAWKELDEPVGGHTIIANSVFNTGRMAYGVSADTTSTTKERIVPATLPDEVAYNDFYNSCIYTKDTGIVYSYGVIMGTEKNRTKVHNNMIFDSWGGDSFNCNVYYDNYTQEFEVYDNVLFNTAEEAGVNSMVYIQSPSVFPDSYATGKLWGNRVYTMLEEGKSAVKENMYPASKPFMTGSSIGCEDYLVNYNSLKNPNTIGSKTYYAKNAKLSEGMYMKDSVAHFTENEQYITFENVDFGEDSNQLLINYKGDCKNTGDDVEVVIGDNLETGTLFRQIRINATAEEDDAVYPTERTLRGVKGINNVYIKVKDYKSIAIDSITTFSVRTDSSYVLKLYGGDFDDAIAGDISLPPAPHYGVDGDDLNPYTNNTWPGTILHYKDVYIMDKVYAITCAASTGNQWSGNIVQVRIGSPTAEPICEIKVEKNNWNDYSEIVTNLAEPIENGEYDIYITFEGEGKSSNLYYIGFKDSIIGTEDTQ